jgi:DNA-binding HxlR family transcriptional regulator
MLTKRLRDLEEKGVVVRQVVPSSPPSVEYSLSELGRELVPVINAIVRVGMRLLESSEHTPAAAARPRARRTS